MIIMMAVRFPAGTNFCSSAALSHNRSICNAEEVTGVNITSRRLFQSGCSNISWNRFGRLNGNSLIRRSNLIKDRIRASASDPVNRNGRTRYHPSEDIAESTLENGVDARLTAAETTRTIVEVNSKATLMFTDFINDGIPENIIWPDLPYVTDEHGNIYFQVKNEEDILQTLTSENNFVQVIIGFDTAEMLKEMDLSGPSDIDFGIDEIEDEDSDIEDEEDEDYDENWVTVLEDEEDETVGDWAKLETMRSCHPMYFAERLAEVASDDPIDWMEQPPAGLAIQGLLRPALIEEHSDIQKHISSNQSRAVDISGNAVENKQDLQIINDHRHESESSSNDSSYAEESKKDGMPINGTSFFKLEMIKIQLILADAHQAVVDVEDFRKAQPDAIAHSAAKIISCPKAGGEKTTQALKSLCWRSKGIQVEEASLIGVDSLGFDLRVCSGTQIQTLRFSFDTRATSEYSAERQLNDLLFPMIHH
ncbi:Pentatricopeptide repeat (PPR) superfamily protein [Melia azedarach]|uniref:Pentatricopeptide repeat (PPR) superfamily protein n=1 Tax=Melia azedarach TaxID=155640 RepID=A0ACC1XCD0_MELAZ|nr:Pentatricopeptide repeat (PPR) superfamily protein [Melia azedarach]